MGKHTKITRRDFLIDVHNSCRQSISMIVSEILILITLLIRNCAFLVISLKLLVINKYILISPIVI